MYNLVGKMIWIWLVTIFVVCLQCTYCHHDTLIGNVGIVGGHNITIEKVPYMVSVRIQNGTFHLCGASIIHEIFVLTAAHCILPNQTYSIVVGTDKINGGNGTLYHVSKIIPHQHYNTVNYQNDICLLKLQKPLAFGKNVKQVTLPKENFKVKKRTMLSAFGWGYTSPNGLASNRLLEVEVQVVSIKACRKAYALKLWIAPTMMCAGGKGHDTCQGDSGGPLTLNGVQVGVTSTGGVCGVQPGIYTKVTSFLTWIRETINKNINQ